MQWGDNDELPAITDLVITNPQTGEELTDSIILSDGWKFLIVLPHLEHADDGVMDRLAELTEYCQTHDYTLVALTASSDSLIDYWRDITGAEYEFLVADEIPLKTMIRSIPVLILLNGSVVVNKWASTQLPGAEELKAPIPQLEWMHKKYSTYWDRLVIIMKWYLFPLLLCFVLDRIWFGTVLYRNRKQKKDKL
jgi:triosephosphate isomerase